MYGKSDQCAQRAANYEPTSRTFNKPTMSCMFIGVDVGLCMHYRNQYGYGGG